jgi:hypothetical protein
MGFVSEATWNSVLLLAGMPGLISPDTFVVFTAPFSIIPMAAAGILYSFIHEDSKESGGMLTFVWAFADALSAASVMNKQRIFILCR